MLLLLPGVLDGEQLAQARARLAAARFVDGRLSAGSAARQVKNNEEAVPGGPQLERLDRLVMESLSRHALYQAAAMPVHAAAPLYARYGPGMGYGEHLDDPIMGAGALLYRSDIAVTLFVSDPTSYEGGALVVRTAFGEQRVKPPAGDAVLYPASSLHRVETVTRGERLVALTWVQSLVRDPARREVLFGLRAARESLLGREPQAPEATQVGAAYLNLVRMWSEL